MTGIDISPATDIIAKSGIRNNSSCRNYPSKPLFIKKRIKVSDKKKLQFYLNLNVLMSSGVDIKTALDIAYKDTSGKTEKALLLSIRDNLNIGKNLSRAMELIQCFSSYEIHSIRIGEESGRLSIVITNLYEYFSKRIAQKRKIINVLTYPAIVLATAIFAIGFMLTYIVPMFENVFIRFGNDELPYITRIIIRISSTLSGSLIHILFFLVSIIVLIILNKHKDWFRRCLAYIILKIPVMGEMMRKLYLARFCMAMELLSGAGVPLVHAIRLVKKMIGFYPIEASLVQVEKEITRGIPLHKCLAAHKIFDQRMVSLVKVAEEVNQLEEVFGKLKKQYNDDVDHRSNSLGSLMEPLLIIVIGLFVGIVLIAMYLPMFELSTTIAK